MSAFMLDKLHIDALVAGDIDSRSARFDMDNGGRALALDQLAADNVGQMLVDANLCSVQARYPDSETNHAFVPGPDDAYYMEPYRFQAPPAQLTALELLSAFACYEYQACESEGWLASKAKSFCAEMRRRLIRRIPGYGNGPWAITDEYYAARPVDGFTDESRPDRAAY